MDRFGVELAVCRGMRITLGSGDAQELNLAMLGPCVDLLDRCYRCRLAGRDTRWGGFRLDAVAGAHRRRGRCMACAAVLVFGLQEAWMVHAEVVACGGERPAPR